MDERKILGLGLRFIGVIYALMQVEATVEFLSQTVFSPGGYGLTLNFIEGFIMTIAKLALGLAMFRFAGILVAFTYPPAPSGARCAKCGYDLRGTPDRCPECGTIPEGAKSRR